MIHAIWRKENPSQDEPEVDSGQVLNKFVKKFKSVGADLVILYERDRVFDIDAVPNVEYMLDGMMTNF